MLSQSMYVYQVSSPEIFNINTNKDIRGICKNMDDLLVASQSLNELRKIWPCILLAWNRKYIYISPDGEVEGVPLHENTRKQEIVEEKAQQMRF